MAKKKKKGKKKEVVKKEVDAFAPEPGSDMPPPNQPDIPEQPVEPPPAPEEKKVALYVVANFGNGNIYKLPAKWIVRILLQAMCVGDTYDSLIRDWDKILKFVGQIPWGQLRMQAQVVKFSNYEDPAEDWPGSEKHITAE